MAGGGQRHRGAGVTRPEGAPLVVVDGAGIRAWQALAPEMSDEPAGVCTTADGWALAAAVHDAADHGIRHFVCCGGDTAWRAVAAGLADLGEDGAFLVAFGGGPASMPRAYGLPLDAPWCARTIKAGGSAPLDTIRVEPRCGEPTEVVNALWWGFGRLAGFLAGARARWGPALRLAAAHPWRDPLDLRFGDVTRGFEASGMLVANGQYLGGLDVAPRAHPGDGKLDVLVFEGRATDIWRMIPRLGSGTHLPHPRVREMHPARLEIMSSGRLFGDGVDVARAPARVAARPGRLRIAI